MKPTRTQIVEHVRDLCDRFVRDGEDGALTSADVEAFEAQVGNKLGEFAEQLESEEDATARAEALGYGHGV